MKLRLYSDVHLEFAKFRPPDHADIDWMILAGDIAPGLAGVAWGAQQFGGKTIYVPGNHEYYGRDIVDLDQRLREGVQKHRITLLHNNVFHLNGIRIIGATLWTDLALYAEHGMDEEEAIRLGFYLNDYHLITNGPRTLHPTDTLARHRMSLDFIDAELSLPYDGKTVVVTHHAPSARSINEKYIGDKLNHLYASHLDGLIETHQPDYWFHGHMHDTVDYTIGKTRVMSNPRGYHRNHVNENPKFDPNWTLEV